MKTKILVAAILLSSCLTGWAGFPKTITQEMVNQIRVGQTTEADLVQLLGPPTTKYLGSAHIVSLDWFRSVPMPPASYLPFIGELCGGLDVEAQQLWVVLGGSGRVIRYEVHSSKNTLKAATQPLRTTALMTRHQR
jgi:hypothetical protein